VDRTSILRLLDHPELWPGPIDHCEHEHAPLTRLAVVGLALNVLGTLGAGPIPYFGMAARYGGPIVWKNPRRMWIGAWSLAWFASVAGAILSFLASGSGK
jgi:hypothetical protein